MNGNVGGILDRLFLHAARPGSKRKMTIKNTQRLRILMASGLRLTYKLDMHSVSLKVRDIQVWQPSMAPAMVSLAGKNTPKL